jgi:hypothetical protein
MTESLLVGRVAEFMHTFLPLANAATTVLDTIWYKFLKNELWAIMRHLVIEGVKKEKWSSA